MNRSENIEQKNAPQEEVSKKPEDSLFWKAYGEDGERIMSALEVEGDQRLIEAVSRYSTIFTLLPNADQRSALENRTRILFEKSAYLLETIHELQSFLEERKDTIGLSDQKKAESYMTNLRNRALHLMGKFYGMGKSNSQKQLMSIVWRLSQAESIERELEISDEELFLNLYWFKYAKDKKPPPTVEDIIGHTVNISPSDQLTEEEQGEIVSIYEDNWKDEEEETRVALVENVKKSFEPTESDNADSEFVTIKNHKEIAGFVRFEDRGEYYYASALNIKKDYTKFGLAESLLDASLISRSIIKPVHARARLSLSYLKKYIERFHAVGTNIEDYHNTPHINLIFSPDQKSNFITANMDREEIVHLESDAVIVQHLGSLEELSLPQGFALTRIFNDKDGGFQCVLEQNPAG